MNAHYLEGVLGEISPSHFRHAKSEKRAFPCVCYQSFETRTFHLTIFLQCTLCYTEQHHLITRRILTVSGWVMVRRMRTISGNFNRNLSLDSLICRAVGHWTVSERSSRYSRVNIQVCHAGTRISNAPLDTAVLGLQQGRSDGTMKRA